jgi:hypothetical protein
LSCNTHITLFYCMQLYQGHRGRTARPPLHCPYMLRRCHARAINMAPSAATVQTISLSSFICADIAVPMHSSSYRYLLLGSLQSCSCCAPRQLSSIVLYCLQGYTTCMPRACSRAWPPKHCSWPRPQLPSRDPPLPSSTAVTQCTQPQRHVSMDKGDCSGRQLHAA